MQKKAKGKIFVFELLKQLIIKPQMLNIIQIIHGRAYHITDMKVKSMRKIS